MTQDQVLVSLKSEITQLEAKISELQTISDPELEALISEEINQCKSQIDALNQSISSLVNDNTSSDFDTNTTINPNNATLEVRPGTGGEEAKIWSDDLIRMYTRFAVNSNWKVEALEHNIIKVSGIDSYNLLKYESGVHRVQRVPSTEASGRIHTSTASVAVLPIIKPQTLVIKEEDLEWQFYRSGGAGGQNVNKVNTAVRLIHTPTGLTVTCSKERSQQQNRMVALDLLRSQLWELEEEKRLGSIEASRRAAVGRAMRSEKIRTYNYPQNRVTDHRIEKSWYDLDRIIEGNLSEVISTIKNHLSTL